jgi:hypothetical protein
MYTYSHINRIMMSEKNCGELISVCPYKSIKYRLKKYYMPYETHLELPASQEYLPSELANFLILTNKKIGPESDLFKLTWLVHARTKIESRSSDILCRALFNKRLTFST